jgi:hypothetical protein
MESANDTLNKKHKHSKDVKIPSHSVPIYGGERLLGQLLSIILGSSNLILHSMVNMECRIGTVVRQGFRSTE